MITTITIELTGVTEAVAGVQKLESSLTRLKPLMEQFGKEFYAEETRLFETAPWTPLKKETEARKAKLYGGPSQILIATKTLFKSLTEEDATGRIRLVEDDGAVFGSSIFYGVFHQEGRGVPERKVLVEPDDERYSTIAGEYAVEMVREAFS